jgi:hypothetical protein
LHELGNAAVEGRILALGLDEQTADNECQQKGNLFHGVKVSTLS